MVNADKENFEVHSFTDHSWNEDTLLLKIRLILGKEYDVPFYLIKKDRPLELATYIWHNVVEQKRRG